MKPILFIDFYQTLSDYHWDIDKEFFDYIFSNNELMKDWMRNKPNTIELFAMAGKHLSKNPELAYEQMLASVPFTTINQNSLDIILELKKRYTTVLITDNMDVFTELTVPALSLNNYFNEIVNSSDIGRLKNENDGQSFKETIEKYGVTIDQCILVDDSASSRKVFESLGGQSPLTKNINDAYKVFAGLIN